MLLGAPIEEENEAVRRVHSLPARILSPAGVSLLPWWWEKARMRGA